jgi:hypothetical protein
LEGIACECYQVVEDELHRSGGARQSTVRSR